MNDTLNEPATEIPPGEAAEQLERREMVSKLKTALVVTPHGVVLPKTMQQVTEFAQYMAKADKAIPAHLRNNPGACMSVIMDSIAWGMNPFSVARMHMVVKETGSYMSQLITAVINRHAPIKGRLVPTFEGDGGQLRCRLNPVTLEGQELPYESPLLTAISPKNSPLWQTEPKQQLAYYSCRAWARRYFPDLLLGVYDPDEAAAMKDITPKPDNFLVDDPEIQVPAESLRQRRDIPQPHEEITETEIARQQANLAVVLGEEIDPETGELMPELPKELDRRINPQTITENLLRGISLCMDKGALDAWTATAVPAIASLPKDTQKQVRKALSDRHIELEF